MSTPWSRSSCQPLIGDDFGSQRSRLQRIAEAVGDAPVGDCFICNAIPEPSSWSPIFGAFGQRESNQFYFLSVREL